MRRALPYLLLVAILAALGIGAAVSAGEDGKKEAAAKRPASAQTMAHHRKALRAHGRRGHGMLRVLADQVLTSSAKRLGVEKSALRKAVRETAKAAFERRFEAAGLTAAERSNMRACKRARRSSPGCDRAAAIAARRKLHAAGLPDLAKEKDLLAGDLAARLGKTTDEVLTAARAELVERLGQAVAMGFVTEKGRDLALGCFDTPATCDLRALHGEVKLPFMRHRRP